MLGLYKLYKISHRIESTWVPELGFRVKRFRVKGVGVKGVGV